jgi:tetratricopeptide (TPR) repeat protein
MDQRRLADILAGTKNQVREGGSGYLVGPRLVLTSRHVVADDEGRPWPRVQVRLGHPGDRVRRTAAASLIWDAGDQDVALLRIDGPAFTGGLPVRWGWFTIGDPVAYTGLGFPRFADYESGRGVEQLSGVLPPLGVGPDGAYVLDQAASPAQAGQGTAEGEQARQWSGVSGAAVFCHGLLVGVVTRDDSVFANRRLYAAPVHALAAHPDFVRLLAEDTGAPPVLEAVELINFLQPPAPRGRARTPGSLLAAGVEAVDFAGRDTELENLAAWRDGPGEFSMMLVTGEGGQGKTRLAREFVSQASQTGWVTGFMAGRAAAGELARQLRSSTRPVLLVADYAETRSDEIAAIADALTQEPPAAGARLLLLSRTAGPWWRNLTEALGEETARRLHLTPLAGTEATRRESYGKAVTSLARHLAMLPDRPVEPPPELAWSTLADRLAEQPPDLDDPRLGNALTLQMTALTDLLTMATGQPPDHSGSPEGQGFVQHERRYLRRAATRRKLFGAGVLSELADDDERAAEGWSALERALAGTILLGPCDASQARSIGALASTQRAPDVVQWLTALYPPSAAEFSLGSVQPDRLAELLLGPILAGQPDLLDRIAALADGVSSAHDILFALVRTAGIPASDQLAAQVRSLIAARPALFAQAALFLAADLPQAAMLGDGLVMLGLRDERAFREEFIAAAEALPQRSVVLTKFSVSLATVLAKVVRRLADAKPDAFESGLAVSLSNLAYRLASAGQPSAALRPASEATSIFRRLDDADPGDYLPELAESLVNLAGIMAQVGQGSAAVKRAKEAVEIRRRLATGDSSDHGQSDLARSLNGLAIQLCEAGDWQSALAPAGEAAVIRQKLARDNEEEYLPDFAKSLRTLGTALARTGRRDDGLKRVRDASTLYRRLARTSPDVYLPDLASSLSEQATVMNELGLTKRAIEPATQAVDLFRSLAQASPDAYLPGLAASLIALANARIGARQGQEAVAPAQETVTVARQLVMTDPDVHLPTLASSLTTVSRVLAMTAQPDAALEPAREAASLWRGLAAAAPGKFLPDLAGSLTNLANVLAETGQLTAALEPAREAVRLFRGLAQDEPDTYANRLAPALHNLATHLIAGGHAQEATQTWESAISETQDVAVRLFLTAAYVAHLVNQPEPDRGIELLVTMLTDEDVPEPFQVHLRELFRNQWRRDPGSVEKIWRSRAGELPAWVRAGTDQA